jgi:hypothetical protein
MAKPIRAVVLFDEQHVLDYEKNQRQDGDVIIPIGPFPRHQATENGWDIRVLNSLWNDNEYHEAKKDSKERITRLIDELNVYSRSIAKHFPIEIGNYFDFFLHNVVGQIHYSWFILGCIQKKLIPKSWLVYKPDNNKLYMHFWPLPENCMYDILINSSLHTATDTVADSLKDRTYITLKQRIKEQIPADLLNYLTVLRQKVESGNYLRRGRKRVLVLGPAYDWGPFLSDDMVRREYYKDYVTGEILKHDKPVTRQLMEIINKSVLYDGKVIYDLGAQARTIQSMISYFDRNAKSLGKQMNKYSAILSSIFVSPEQNFMVDVAGKLNKPVICWQHGEMGCSFDPFAFGSEVRYTTHYLCYAPLVKAKYESFIGKGRLKHVYSVGNCRKRVEWKEKRYILYATGKWMKNGMPFNDVQDPDTRLYEAQKSILTYLNSIGKDYEVIFKTSNTQGANEMVFNYENIRVESSISFTSLLENASIVILDSPATTCIETASTKVPLFILSGRTEWYELPMSLLKKRAVVADKPEDLVVNLRDYLHKGIYQADTENTEYFNGYGSENSIDMTKQAVYNILADVTGHELS